MSIPKVIDEMSAFLNRGEGLMLAMPLVLKGQTGETREVCEQIVTLIKEYSKTIREWRDELRSAS